MLTNSSYVCANGQHFSNADMVEATNTGLSKHLLVNDVGILWYHVSGVGGPSIMNAVVDERRMRVGH